MDEKRGGKRAHPRTVDVPPSCDESGSITQGDDVLSSKSTVSEILKRLGLEKHGHTFEKNEINYTAFKLLKESDLRDLEIPIGARAIIRDEIERMNKEGPINQSSSNNSTGGEISQCRLGSDSGASTSYSIAAPLHPSQAAYCIAPIPAANSSTPTTSSIPSLLSLPPVSLPANAYSSTNSSRIRPTNIDRSSGYRRQDSLISLESQRRQHSRSIERTPNRSPPIPSVASIQSSSNNSFRSSRKVQTKLPVSMKDTKHSIPVATVPPVQTETATASLGKDNTTQKQPLDPNPKNWKNNCLICEENSQNRNFWNPLESDLEMNIGSHLPSQIVDPGEFNLERYVPDLNTAVRRFPVGRFHQQVDKSLQAFNIETDLKNDEFLRLFMKEKGIVKEGSIRDRNVAIVKEELCRKVYGYAMKLNVKPSLVLSQYDWDTYLFRCGGHCTDFYMNKMQNKLLKGSCDCVWITQDRGLFLMQSNAVGEITTDPEKVIKYIKNTWEQTHKARLFLKSFISDHSFKADLVTHQIITFPNLSSNIIEKYLCDQHKKMCMSKETLEDHEMFEEFFQNYLPIHLPLSHSDYMLLAARCILLCSAIEFLPKSIKPKNPTPLETPKFSKKVRDKIEKVGKDPLYMTPRQKKVIDNFSIEEGNENYWKVIINGHFGTGKTYTLLLGIKKLVDMIQNKKDDQKHLIVFLSAKEEWRQNKNDTQNGESHLKDCYQFLQDLLYKNKNVPFLIVEDKFDLRDQQDKGLVGQTGTNAYEVFRRVTRSTAAANLALSGLLDTLKKIFFHSDKKYVKSCESAKQKRKRIEKAEVSYEKQLIYNFPQNDTDSSKNKLEEYNIHLFADEVDHTTINWHSVRTITSYRNSILWFAMNSEKCNNNKKVIEGMMPGNSESVRDMTCFQEITLNHILRNTRLNGEFVNDMRKALSENTTEKLLNPKIGHCIDGFVPKVLFLEKYTNPSIPEYHHTIENFTSVPITTYQIYQMLPNAITTCIIQMFDFAIDTKLVDIVAKMNQNVCIISLNLINDYLIKCLILMDEEETFREKMQFETPSSSIGREFDNVIYVAPSYMYIKDPETNDIVYSDLMNVCSRPKSQLFIIDVGRYETEKVHITEARSLFQTNEDMVRDKIHQLDYNEFLSLQSINVDKFRHDILSDMIQKANILPLQFSSGEAIQYLKDNSGANPLKEQSLVQKLNFDRLVKEFEKYKSQDSSNFRDVGFFPKLIPELKDSSISAKLILLGIQEEQIREKHIATRESSVKHDSTYAVGLAKPFQKELEPRLKRFGLSDKGFDKVIDTIDATVFEELRKTVMQDLTESLCKEAREGNLDKLKFILNQIESNELHLENGITNIAKDLMLKRPQLDIPVPKPNSDYRLIPLIEAAKHGQINVCKYLIDDKKVNIETRDGNECTAFAYASRNGYLSILKLLMNRNTNVLPLDQYGSTLLMGAAKNGHIDICEYLMEDKRTDTEARDDHQCTALIYASRNGHLSVVKLLIDHNDKILTKDEYGITLLKEAIMNNHIDICEYLIKDRNVDIKAPDSSQCTAFICALQNGRLEIVELFIDHDPRVLLPDEYGITPLMEAAKNGHIEICKYLIKDQNVDIEPRDSSQCTAFMYALRNGYLDIVKLFIDHDTRVLAPDEYRMTPLMEAAKKGHPKICEHLIKDQNVDIEARDFEQRTAIIYATNSNHIGAAQILIDYNVNLYSKDEYACYSLFYAARNGNLEMVKILSESNHDLVELKGHEGRTPLIEAAYYGHLEVCNYFVKSGKANVNAKDDNNDTAIMKINSLMSEFVKGNMNDFNDHIKFAGVSTLSEMELLYPEIVNVLMENGAEGTYFQKDKLDMAKVRLYNRKQDAIQRCIKSLVHACQCRDVNCGLPSCSKMKRVVSHSKQCKRKSKGGCPICKQLIALCFYHAKMCPEAKCPVPFCQSIKNKLKEQSGTDMLRQNSMESTNAQEVNSQGNTAQPSGASREGPENEQAQKTAEANSRSIPGPSDQSFNKALLALGLPAQEPSGPVNKVQRTDGRQHVPNVVPPKSRVATLTRRQGGQRPLYFISWMDAPDDFLYKATPNTKKLRKKMTVVQIRKAARNPFKRLRSLHPQ